MAKQGQKTVADAVSIGQPFTLAGRALQSAHFPESGLLFAAPAPMSRWKDRKKES
jgi:hypothetical protein